MGSSLHDKVALISGGTRGVGRASARRLAEAGAAVVISGRNTDTGQAAEREILEDGGRALYVQTDVGREDDVKRCIEAAVATFGGLTTIVNNAAPTDSPQAQTTGEMVTALPTEEWERVLRVGVSSAFWHVKHGAPHLAAAGGGSIINISSAGAVMGTSGTSAYSAAKGALNAATRVWAVELAADAIRVNCVVVGLVMSEVAQQLMSEKPELKEILEDLTLTRPGTPDDIACATHYLASDDAAFVTGSIMTVDGGLTSRLKLPG